MSRDPGHERRGARTRALRQIVVFLVVCAVTAFVSIATAQRSKGGGKGGAHPPKKGQDAAAPSTPAPMTPDPERAPATPAKAEPKTTDRLDGGVIETRTGDGGTKSYRFEEVSIEGRLQSPELVYFLRRVRAEFNAGELGHRSFMGELSDSKKDPNLR